MSKLRVLVVGGGALVAFLLCAVAAHATIVTSPAGSQYWSTISAEASNSKFEGSFVSVPCKKAVVTWKVESQGAGATAEGKATSLAFYECAYPVTVHRPGSVIKHTTSSGNATVTGHGQEITVHSSVGGCVFSTNASHWGLLKGGFPARFVADGTWVRTGGSFFCGSSMHWTADFTVTTPSSLSVD